jgi:tetratricopeptide (TPR) repeat protein
MTFYLQIAILTVTGLLSSCSSPAQSSFWAKTMDGVAAQNGGSPRDQAQVLLAGNNAERVPQSASGSTGSESAADLERQGDQLRNGAREAESEEFYRKALAADPSRISTGLKLGMLLASERRWEEAMSLLEAVLHAEPENEVAANGEVESAIQLALDARRRGDRDAALIALLRARKYVPGSVRLLTSLGILEDEMRLYKDADVALEDALLHKPDDADALYAAARVNMDLQNLPQAETYMRDYLRQKPNDATAHYGLGRLLLMAQRPEQARLAFERSVELQPEQVESYYQIGDIDLEAGELDRAQQLFQKALERDPKHGGALCGMGMLEYRRKQYDKAVAELNLAVQSAPNYQKAHYYLGLALAKTGRKADADREFAIATRLADEENHRQANRLQLKGPLQAVPDGTPRK